MIGRRPRCLSRWSPWSTASRPAAPAAAGRGRPVTYPDRLFLKALVVMVLQAPAHGPRAAGRAGPADRRDAAAARAADRRRALPDAADLGAAAGGAARDAAGADRLPGAAPGRAARPVGGVRARGRHRQHGAARQGRRLAQEAPRGRGGAAHLDRHRGALDQVGLARLGLRLEAAPGRHRRRRLAPAPRGADPRQRRRQRAGAPPALADLPAEVRFVLGDRHYQTRRCTTGPPTAGRTLVASRRGGYPHTDDGVEVRRVFHKLRSAAHRELQRPVQGHLRRQGAVPTRG